MIEIGEPPVQTPRPPDLERDRILVFIGASIPDAMRWPLVAGMRRTLKMVAESPDGTVEEVGRVVVVPMIGTVDELADHFRERLGAAARLSLMTPDAFREGHELSEEDLALQKKRWEGNVRMQEWARKRDGLWSPSSDDGWPLTLHSIRSTEQFPQELD